MALIKTVLTISSTKAPLLKSLMGLFKPCKIGPIATGFSAPLHRFISDVSGVQIRENKNASLPSHLAVRHFFFATPLSMEASNCKGPSISNWGSNF